DPTEPIARYDFYAMLAKHCHLPAPPAEAGIAPIYADEAFGLLARVVDGQPARRGKKRGERWFEQPAMAEPAQHRQVGDKPLHYLDAAQMVLEAGSTLR